MINVKHLIGHAYFELIRFDSYLLRGKFETLYETVRRFSVRTSAVQADAVPNICRAMDVACIWYFKQVLCLQRSAATTCLLRRFGVNAQLVLGAQQIPFRAHAWVEVDGLVVNDKSYIPEDYAVLDRC